MKEMKLPTPVQLPTELTLEVIRNDDFTKAYASIDALINQLTEQKKNADEKIKSIMQAEYLRTGNQTIKATGVTYTYVPGSVRESFDSAKFKAENPELYKKYTKTSTTKESLRVKVTKEEE